MLRSILLVLAPEAIELLSDRLEKLDEKVFVVAANGPEQTMNIINDYISLMDVLERLVESGIIIDDDGDFELSDELVQNIGRKGGSIPAALRSMAPELNDNELVQAAEFLEGFMEV